MHSTRFYHFAMFDNLAAYYHENVVSSFVAYRNISKDKTAGCSRDLRMALAAASALFHLREHLPTRTLTRTEIERLCPDYALLGDIVNASKHKVLSNQTPHGQPLVNDAKNLEEQLIVIEYEDDLGTYRFVQKTVVVKLNDGSVQNLINVLTNVMNFWEQHMQSLGISSVARTFTHDSHIRARTRSECQPDQLDFNFMKGVRFSQKMLYLRFNNNTGKVEPIDLTGYQAQLQIYPPIEVELLLTHESSGKVFNTSITLTGEENAHLSRMQNDFERQAYINGLSKTQAALNQLAVETGIP